MPRHRTQRVIASRMVLRPYLAVLFIIVTISASSAEQRSFRSPEGAAQALVNALTSSDEKALETLFGSDFRKAIPSPQGAAAEARNRFLEAWAHSHKLVTVGNKTKITVGADSWTFPVPIVKTASSWRFDTASGVQEIWRVRHGKDPVVRA